MHSCIQKMLMEWQTVQTLIKHHTAPSGAAWSGSTLFARTRLSKNLGSLCTVIQLSNKDIWGFMSILDMSRIVITTYCIRNKEWAPGRIICAVVEVDMWIWNMSRHMTKPTKWLMHPVKTQISLGYRPVWSESSLSAWRKLGSLATHWVYSEDSDQSGRMPRLIRIFTGCTGHFVGFVMLWLIWSNVNCFNVGNKLF